MNIVTYVQDKADQVTKRLGELGESKSQLMQRQTELQTEHGKVERAYKKAVAAGLPMDTKATDKLLSDISAKISSNLVELEILDQKMKEAKEAQNDLIPLAELASVCRDKLGLLDIPELKSVSDVQDLLRANVVFEQDNASACVICVGDWPHPIWKMTLPIKTSITRVRCGVVPRALTWVPREWLPINPDNANSSKHDATSLLADPQNEPSQIYYIVEDDAFRLLTPAMNWEEDQQRQVGAHHWERRTETVRVSMKMVWGKPEECLTSYLTKTFAEKFVDLDADADYAILKSLKKAILDVTRNADDIVYVSNSEQQTTTEIEKSIGEHFRAFVEAPWTCETTGLLANFKYYCEQGESPRFHNLNVIGAYGFRLRTRDHSWIKGNLYVVPKNIDYSSASNKVPEIKPLYGRKAVLRMGRLILFVECEESL